MARVTAFPQRKSFPVRRIGIGAVVLVALLVLLGVTGVLAQVRPFIPWLSQPGPSFQTTPARVGDVTVSVTATGPIAAVDTVPLTFKTSGKLAQLKVDVGQPVKKGQVLAVLDPTDLTTALNQAKANLDQAQANLTKVERGPTADQQAVAQASLNSAKLSQANAVANVATTQTSVADDVATAQQSVQTAQQGLVAAQHSLQSANDQETRGLAADQAAIVNDQKNLDTVKASVAANAPTLLQGVSKAKDSLWGTQISRDASCSHGGGNSCDAANASVASAQLGVDTAQAQLVQGQIQGKQQIDQAQTTLDQANTTLADDTSKLAAAVVSAQDQVKQAQNALANAQAGVVQAQHKAGASLQSAQQQADTAAQSLQSAQANYNESTAPPDAADVATAKAQVLNAQSALDTAQANFDAATLTSPMDATIGAINGSAGQYVSGGPVAVGDTALFTLLDLNNLKVTSLVNEADIGQVNVGDPVTFTVNAYPNTIFNGKVLTIQPQGTTVQNVVTYSVTCSIISTKSASLYPGMTATASIITNQRTGVVRVPNTALSLPQTAIRDGLVSFARPTRTGTPFARPTGTVGRATGTRSVGAGGGGANGGSNGAVLVLESGKPSLVRVGLGITDGSYTEITSGLTADQPVIVSIVGATAANRTVATPGANGGGPRPGGGSPFGGLRG